MPSNGSLWYGKIINFPGFLYKKNTGGGVRRNPSYGLICNQPTDLNNRYISGAGVGATTISNRRYKTRMATKCCNEPIQQPPYSYSGTFIYSFTLLTQLPSFFTREFSEMNPNNTIKQTPININSYIKQYIPISSKDKKIQYSYTALLYPNMFVVVKINYNFIDDGVTSDGLQFTLDKNNTVQNFYNNNTTNLSVHSFGNIPLSRYTTVYGNEEGRQFSKLQVNFVSKNAPTILTNTSLSYCFSNDSYSILLLVDVSLWDVSNAISMDSMFLNCSVFSSDLSSWNTGNVTSMSAMFRNCPFFESDLSKWNTSKVTSMKSMFYNNIRFTSDLSAWDTSEVTDMSSMFYFCSSFNSDIYNWNTSKVTSMSYMFYICTSFISDLSAWDTSKVTDMSYMFNTSYFNSDLSKWNTSNVTDMTAMFYFLPDFTSDLSKWDTSKVTSMNSMFYLCDMFNSDLSNWDTNNVTDMSFMFYFCPSFNSDLSLWKTGNVLSMESMFQSTFNFTSDLSLWKTGKVTTMTLMFNNCAFFNSDLSQWDTSNVTTMASMFNNAKSFNGNISTWNTINVTNMSYMFSDADLFNSDISAWDTSNVTSMAFMFGSFSNAHDLSNIDLSLWDISKVIDMSFMFVGASNLNNDLSNWSLNPNVNLCNIFGTTNNFNIILPNVNVYKNIFLLFGDSPEYYHLSFVGIFNGSTNFQGDLSGWTILNNPDDLETFTYTFANSTNFTANVSNWTINQQNFKGLFYYSSGFNPIGLDTWTINPTDMSLMFSGASNCNADFSTWGNQLSNLITMESLFENISNNSNTANFVVQGLNNWDVSNVTIMSKMLANTSNAGQAGFPLDFIQDWDVSNVFSMSHFFLYSSGMTCDLTNWASKIVNLRIMRGFLEGISDFNVIGLDIWNIENVIDISYLFAGTTGFNYDFVNNWNISNITDISGLFSNATNFVLNLTWNVSNVKIMSLVFNGTVGFNNTFIESWDTSNVIDMSDIFEYSTNFGENIDLSGWSTTNVKTFSRMFKGVSNFLATGLDSWDTSGVTIMSGLFSNTVNFDITYDFILAWDVTSVTDVSYLFSESDNFSIDLSSWFTNSNNVTTMAHLFDGIISINPILSNSIKHWSLSNVTNISGMFGNVYDFFDGSFAEDWDVSSVTDMSYLFYYNNLPYSDEPIVPNKGFTADLSNWDVSSVVTMESMFLRNVNFNGTGLDVWQTSSLEDMSYMFAISFNLNALFTELWNTSKVTTMKGMLSSYGINIAFATVGIQLNASKWDTSSLTDLSFFMKGLDNNNTTIISQQSDITGLEYFNTSNVTTLKQAFAFTEYVVGTFIEHWNVLNLVDMTAMAQDAKAFNPNLTLFAPQLCNVTNESDLLPPVDGVQPGVFMGATSFYGSGLSDACFNNLVSVENFLFGCTSYALGFVELTPPPRPLTMLAYSTSSNSSNSNTNSLFKIVTNAFSKAINAVKAVTKKVTAKSVKSSSLGKIKTPKLQKSSNFANKSSIYAAFSTYPVQLQPRN
jgi:surface protein